MLKLKAFSLLGLGIVTLTAVVWIFLTNIGNSWDLHLFFKSVSVRRGLLLIYAGGVGILLWKLWWWCLPAGMTALKACRKAKAASATASRLEKLESHAESKSSSGK